MTVTGFKAAQKAGKCQLGPWGRSRLSAVCKQTLGAGECGAGEAGTDGCLRALPLPSPSPPLSSPLSFLPSTNLWHPSPHPHTTSPGRWSAPLSGTNLPPLRPRSGAPGRGLGRAPSLFQTQPLRLRPLPRPPQESVPCPFSPEASWSDSKGAGWGWKFSERTREMLSPDLSLLLSNLHTLPPPQPAGTSPLAVLQTRRAGRWGGPAGPSRSSLRDQLALGCTVGWGRWAAPPHRDILRGTPTPARISEPGAWFGGCLCPRWPGSSGGRAPLGKLRPSEDSHEFSLPLPPPLNTPHSPASLPARPVRPGPCLGCTPPPRGALTSLGWGGCLGS